VPGREAIILSDLSFFAESSRGRSENRPVRPETNYDSGQSRVRRRLHQRNVGTLPPARGERFGDRCRRESELSKTEEEQRELAGQAGGLDR
jgi:hypothetical protein